MYPPLSPILFQVGPFSLHWYGLIMVVAIVIAAWIASRYVTRHGQESNTIWDMLLWVLIPALIGERLYYVFIQSPRGPNGLGHYLANPIEIVEIWRGGLSYLWRLHLWWHRPCPVRLLEKTTTADLSRRGSAGSPARTSHRALGKLHQPGTLWAANDAAVGTSYRQHSPHSSVHRHDTLSRKRAFSATVPL